MLYSFFQDEMRNGMKKLLIPLAIIAIVLLIIGFFLFFRQKEANGYNFIFHFDEAQKINFDDGSDLDKFLPTRSFIFNQHLLNKQVYLLFSQNVNMLAKNGEIKNDIKENVGSAGFRLIFPAENQRTEATVIFKKKDESNYWFVSSISNDFSCELKVFRVKNGNKEQLDSFGYKFAKNKSYIIMVVFFRDFLVILNENRVLFQMKSPDLLETGKIGFNISPQAVKGFTLKFAKMDSKIESYLLNWYSNSYPSAPNHMFNYLQEVWNQISYKPFLIINDEQNNFLRRLKVGNETRPAIFFKMNSELSYELKIPKKSVMEFYLSVVPVYISTRDRLRFVVEVEPPGRGNKKKIDVNLGSHPRISQRFIPHNLDLSEFGGKKCKVTFRFSTIDGKLKNNEEKIILSLASPVIYPERKKDEYNVILISLDTLRASNLSCYGYSRNTSANIDAFASEGTMFSNAASSSDWTLPSHMSMLTSLYPFEVGFTKTSDNSAAKRMDVASFGGSFIADKVPTIAEYLQKAGYKTIGIHGGGYVSEYYGFDKGFDVYNKRKMSVTDAVDIAVKVLEKSKNRKFFMFFHTYEIHEPYKHEYYLSQLSHSDRSFQNRVIAKYDSGIRFTDFEIGRLLEWLKKNGLFEKTLVIITSDHGENFDYLRKNPEAGSHGLTLFDVETHVPLLFGGPAVFNESHVVKDQVSLVDILPTIMDFLDIPLESEIRGSSLMPLIDNGDKIGRMAYSEGTYTVIEKKSIRSLHYKLIATIARKDADGSLDIKYELFNLSNDKKEKEDVLHLEPEAAKQYMTFLNKIVKSVEENRARLVKSTKVIPGHDKELLDDLKGLGYIGN